MFLGIDESMREGFSDTMETETETPKKYCLDLDLFDLIYGFFVPQLLKYLNYESRRQMGDPSYIVDFKLMEILPNKGPFPYPNKLINIGQFINVYSLSIDDFIDTATQVELENPLENSDITVKMDHLQNLFTGEPDATKSTDGFYVTITCDKIELASDPDQLVLVEQPEASLIHLELGKLVES